MRLPRVFSFASIASFVAASLAGCAVVVPARDALPPEAGEAQRALVEPGAAVMVREGGRCSDLVADTFGGLEPGAPISSAAWAAAPTRWRVRDARVRLEDDSPGFVALELGADDGRHTWIRSAKLGAPMTCVVPADAATQGALDLVGKSLVFTPWKPSCTRIEATGRGALAALVEGHVGAPMKVDGVTSVNGSRPWLGLSSGSVEVPYDVAARCFSPATGGAAADAQPLALLHTDAARCLESTDGGKPHVECRSTVGAWKGKADASGVDLVLVRRTLGDVNFTGGQPVDGRRYAHTVVSVATGSATDTRLHELYGSLGVALAQAVASEDTSVRVARPNDPAVTCKLKADVDGLRIGELVRRDEPMTSQYQDGFRDVPNPEFPVAQQALRAAEADVVKENAAYEQHMREWQAGLKAVDEAKKLCEENCSRIGGFGAIACKAGCVGGGVAVGVATKPGREPIQAAEARVAQTRAHAAQTPPSVREPVMKTWSYTRTVFQRDVSATLRLEVAPNGASPRAVTVPLASAWHDFEVAADPQHNVEGHTPDRGPIQREDALMPMITRVAATEAAKQLHAAIEQSEADSARRALAGSSGGDAQPGYELLDATALGATGGRLRGAIGRGRSFVSPGKALELPASEAHLGSGKCVVAVAAVEGGADARVTLRSHGDAFADVRGKRTALLEICNKEAQPAGRISLELEVTAPAQVRWTLYATSESAP